MPELTHSLEPLGGNGVALALERWRPPEVQGIIALTHGLGEHPGRYQDLIQYFGRRGFATYGVHLRGHGRSGGRRGHCNSLDELVDDALRGIQAAAAAEPGSPLLLYGHSLGGLVLLKLLGMRGAELPAPARAAVVSGPAVRVYEVPPWKVWAGWILSQIMPTMAFSSAVRPDLLSSDPEVARTYVADPLVHHLMSARLGVEILQAGAQVLALAPRITLPCLLIHGADDAVTNPAGSHQVATALAGPHLLRIYPGMCHELHNEQRREQVFCDIEQWAQQYLLPSGQLSAAEGVTCPAR